MTEIRTIAAGDGIVSAVSAELKDLEQGAITGTVTATDGTVAVVRDPDADLWHIVSVRPDEGSVLEALTWIGDHVILDGTAHIHGGLKHHLTDTVNSWAVLVFDEDVCEDAVLAIETGLQNPDLVEAVRAVEDWG